MSTFDDASLVFIPSGYKTSKAYSVKPIDGSGDLTFTRSNDTATRVNSAGLIEKVRTNLVLQSQTFDNVYWNKLASSVSANATTAPDGTLTAEKLVENSANAFHALEGSSFAYSAGEHSWSVFAKAGERNVLQLLMNGSLNITAVANFNLTTGVVSLQTDCVASIESIGNGWFRCSMVYAATTATVPIGYYSIQTSPTAARATTYLGDGTSGLFVWGAQMTTGVTTAYIPTTTAAVSVGPVANVPRLDYLGSSCPRLLLEPQRTNLALYSEQFDNAYWDKPTGIVATANQTISPDGTTNADTIEKAGGSGGTNYYYVVKSITSNTTNTFSVFAKYKEGSGIIWLLGKNSSTFAYFNLQTGTALSATAGMTTKIENYGNGWYRCSFTQDYTGATNYTVGVGLCLVNGTPNYNATTAATQGVYIYGAQFEAGAYATSYIPTLGAAVTRGADAASKTSISSLIGQTEGVLYFEFNGGANDSINYGISLSDGTTNNRIIIFRSNTNTLITNIRTAATTVAQISTTTLTADATHKVAVGYANNDVVFYVNGVQIGTDTSAAIPSTNRIVFDDGGGSGAQFYRPLNQLILFKTRLSNADLAALTTL